MVTRHHLELMRRASRGARLGLDGMRAALDRLDHPERQLRVLHVAGTNGKGSTSAMLESIARAAGARTGMFTSPHLCRLCERIRIDGEPIDDALFAAVLDRALGPELPRLSFFEAMTVAGLLAMREAGVEVAVLEVGMGGRLDATNAVEAPACTAITTIGYDHTAFLGHDLASIAREKAGIVKPGVPLVLGRLEPEPAAAILERAAEAGPVWRLGVDGHLDGQRLVSPGYPTVTLRPRLRGAHQLDNAAVAVMVARASGIAGVEAALEVGVARAEWPGRMEQIGTVLLDCAHNVDGIRAFVAAAPRREGAVLVYGALRDKAWREALDLLAPLCEQRVYCPPIEELGGRGPADPAELAAHLPGEVRRTPAEAVDRALELARDTAVLVVGSIFLVGAVRAHLLGIEHDMLVPL